MEKITANNFITDINTDTYNKTDKVYISSLIDTVEGNLDINTRSELKKCILKFCPDCDSLYNTRDVWARDYMPIQLTENIYLSFIYRPDYLADYIKCTTDWRLHKVHSQKQTQEEFLKSDFVQMIPIILDGGNVVKAIVNNKPCIIMCDKVLWENNVNEKEFRDWWGRWCKDNFNGTEMQLVLLPWEGKDVNPIGHADGIVRYIGNNKVLMTNYADYDQIYGSDYSKLYRKKLSEVGFDVIELSYLDKLDYENDKLFRLLFKYSWCYINYLQVDNKILIPSLGYDVLDNEAKQQVEQALNVEVKLIDVDMTSIVEDMNDNQNSGGALNCLTWTIRKNKE